MLNFKFNQNEINKIGQFSKKEKDFRLKNLLYFNEVGFPNKRSEEWKFSDLNDIISKNFKNLKIKFDLPKKQNIEFIKDFEHNYIIITNGELSESNFKFENKSKIKIQSYSDVYSKNEEKKNPLIFLNNALSNKGYYLKVDDNYKFEKILVIYNLFTDDLNENILNSRNLIQLGKNSEVHTLTIDINKSKKNFFNNVFETLTLSEASTFKNIYLQNNKSNGYFHKYLKSKLLSDTNYSSYILTKGLKFNKIDLEFDLEGERSECNLKAASFINKNEHQEIKTRINHYAPNCKSFQKVKNCVEESSKGVYQGKIFVKDVAQKTDAYQLSKAILLAEDAEFDAKPELEIYADDVKCSHGSTSGSIDENAVYYLMSRGLNKEESIKLLVEGFLNEIVEDIKNNSIKNYIEKKLNY